MQHFIIGQRGQQVIEGTEQIVGNAGIADGHVARAKQHTCQLPFIQFPVAARSHDGKTGAPNVRATGQPSGFRMQATDNAAENSLAGSTGSVSSLC